VAEGPRTTAAASPDGLNVAGAPLILTFSASRAHGNYGHCSDICANTAALLLSCWVLIRLNFYREFSSASANPALVFPEYLRGQIPHIRVCGCFWYGPVSTAGCWPLALYRY